MAPPLRAQAADHLLRGRVTGAGSAPVAGARVRAAGHGEPREARTDSAGAYRIRLPAGVDAYLVSVEAEGFRSSARVVSVAPGAAETLADFSLALRLVALEPVEVLVPRLSIAEATRWTPGTVDQARLGVELRTEPLGVDGLSDVLDRQVGVARVATPDGAGISMMGRAPDQTRLTMDGTELGAVAIPREAIRAVNVVTNTFDVARGRFTGGQVDLQTQRAGNDWGTTVRMDRREPRLQYGDTPGGLRARAGTWAIDAGSGGALLRDRLFGFGALTARSTESRVLSLDRLDSWSVRRLGVSPDTLQRFLDLASRSRPGDAGEQRRASSLVSGLLRLDAVLSPLHTVTFRVNGQRSRLPDAGSALALAGTGSELRASGLGLLAQLSSGGRRVANELRLHGSRAERSWSYADEAPEGVVNIAPAAGDGDRGLVSLRFAGSPLSAGGTRESGVEVSDQVVVTTGDRGHRFRVGGDAGIRDHTWEASAGNGTFVFADLAGLEQGRPALFTRSFDQGRRGLEVRRISLFADDLWRPGSLELSYGLRAERVRHLGSSEPNPLVEARFAEVPGTMPARWRVSPRLGFSWEARMPWDGREGRTAIQGGIGEFVGALPAAAVGAALSETGAADAGELVCAGPEAPTPDWNAYRADPRSIPTACVNGVSPFASRLPTATVFDSRFQAPRAWRAAVNGQGLLPNGVIWGLSISWLHGRSQPVAFDRNLVTEPRFVNEEEGRPVFVGPDAIDPVTGSPSVRASRRFGDLGTVREITSEGRSRSLQASATAAAFLGPVGFLGPMRAELGYTWTDARESVTPVGALGSSGTTAGDPFRLDWAPAPWAPRQRVHAYAEWRQSSRLSFGLTASVSSGRPFTPVVAGDVNGDGMLNDRAFVFDPAGSVVDENVQLAMAQLLRDAPRGVRRCLRSQLGEVSGHNSCRGSWTTSLDVNARLHFGSRIAGSSHKRLTVWIVARNVPAGLDYLLHGAHELRGWGQDAAVDPTLLAVRGFDPASRRFLYAVNPRFGRPAGDASLLRAPFSISIQGRIVVGNDRVLTQFRDAMGAGRGQDPALAARNLRLHLSRQLLNVPGEVLSLDAPRQLGLSMDQAKALQWAADSLAVQADTLVRAFVAALADSPAPDAAHVRELTARAIAWRRDGARIARALLSHDQWERLPRSLREPATSFAPFPPQRLTSPTDF